MATVPWNSYRAYRIFTPWSMLAEARGQIMGKVVDSANCNLQFKLKQVLLQEVLSVAINLYSGRFQVGDDELEQTRAALQNQACMAKEPDPLRVCLLGLVSTYNNRLISWATT